MTKTIAPPDGEIQAVRSATTQRRWRTGAVVLGWILFLVLWDLISRLVGEVRVPSPRTVGEVMWEIIRSGLFIEHFLASIGKVALGFVFAILFGAPIGFLMGRSAYWKAFFKDTVMVAGSIPGLTYAVMMLVIFGISLVGPVLAVAMISMPYIAINVAEGLEGVDRRLLQMSQAYGRKPRDISRHVLVPAILPFVFAGVRLSFAISWKVEQLTEVFGSNRGVGFQIRSAFQRFSVPEVLGWVLLFIAFMLVVERVILVRMEHRLFRWRGEGEA